jgi:EAL domain-containing protein (putative c-di-GMP-specific phosphodiesterase class I)
MISITKEIKNLMLNQSENILIGRNSGEASFMFVYPSIDNKRLNLFSAELSKCITKPITINGNSINLYTSIGICHSTDIWDTDMVFNFSKLALQSISDQRNTFCIFDAEMQMAYQKEKELEEDIRESLSEKHFIAHYQPKVLCDGNIIGYEALVRWTRKDSIEFPGMFINKIEKMGMIQSLFNIVFEKICQDFDKSEKIKNVSINISPSQLAKKDLLRNIYSIISDYTIEPQHITFEFVETALLNSDYYSTIKELKRLGFKLSLDDFGTGYARYKTLIDLFNQGFVNEIKIDKVFIDDIESSANQSFIKSISYLASEFDVSTFVEGVETIDQFSRIKSINPNIIIQGWLVSKA